MRECHPALHLGGCTANQTGSSHALQPTTQSAQQHLIQGMMDKQGGSASEWVGGSVGGLQGMDVGERGSGHRPDSNEAAVLILHMQAPLFFLQFRLDSCLCVRVL